MLSNNARESLYATSLFTLRFRDDIHDFFDPVLSLPCYTEWFKSIRVILIIKR